MIQEHRGTPIRREEQEKVEKRALGLTFGAKLEEAVWRGLG